MHATPDPDKDRELRKLWARVNAMDADLQSVTAQLPAPRTGRREDAGPVNRDARWHCEKCGYLLGFIDIANDVLRTRYKEHIVFVRCGPGGFCQVICRGCSEVNTLHGTEADEANPQDAG
jgi:hypothetical protein